MSKVIPNIKSATWQDWIEVWCWFFTYEYVSIETKNWFSYFNSYLPVRLLDSFTKNVPRMAWSFDFIFCATVQNHHWNLLTWTLVTVVVFEFCRCSSESSLVLVIILLLKPGSHCYFIPVLLKFQVLKNFKSQNKSLQSSF